MAEPRPTRSVSIASGDPGLAAVLPRDPRRRNVAGDGPSPRTSPRTGHQRAPRKTWPRKRTIRACKDPMYTSTYAATARRALLNAARDHGRMLGLTVLGPARGHPFATGNMNVKRVRVSPASRVQLCREPLLHQTCRGGRPNGPRRTSPASPTPRPSPDVVGLDHVGPVLRYSQPNLRQTLCNMMLGSHS